MGTAYFADLVKQFGGAALRAGDLQRRAEPDREMDCRQAGARARRVHRRHPVPRDAELREADPRHRGGLPAPLRARRAGGRGRRDPRGRASVGERRRACRAGQGRRPRRPRPRRAAAAKKKPAPAKKKAGRPQEEGRLVSIRVTQSRLYVQTDRIEESDAVHRVGHPRDDAAQSSLRRRQPVAGLPGLSRRRQAIKDAACAAINADVNQYAVTWGARPLREAIAREFTRRYGLEIVADEQVTVCCGTTEAMMSTMMAIIDPGDEVVIFEPFYENYGPDAILSGATPRYVTLHAPDRRSRFDPDAARRAPRRSTRRPRRSSSTRRTTRPGRCSRATSSR